MVSSYLICHQYSLKKSKINILHNWDWKYYKSFKKRIDGLKIKN